MQKLRMADHRGFVWKMMIMSVIGMRLRLVAKSKKLTVPKRDLA